MDMNIQKYMAFVETVESGSFTRAAQKLDYSQSGISRMIHDLETEWGISLLERGHSGVRLTSDGLKLLPYAKRVCDEFQNLQTQVDELKGMEAGLIRIGTFSSVATHWLPNIIKKFQEDYPNIDYELLLGDYTEIESWITEGRVDCGFLKLSMVESGLGISILPKLILQRIPYRIVTKELEVPACRKIGLAFRDRKGMSLAVKRFLDYLEYR